MKKILPTSEKYSKGFTLIELLVVIAIIAVLAVMGIAVFSGLTGRGNDDRRRADLRAISDALEVKRSNATTYQSITVNDFAGGAIPQEPTSRTEKYCYTDGTAAIANPAAWSGAACPTTGAGNGTGWMTVGGTTAPTVSATATNYKVCTIDQGSPVAVICFGNRQ